MKKRIFRFKDVTWFEKKYFPLNKKEKGDLIISKSSHIFIESHFTCDVEGYNHIDMIYINFGELQEEFEFHKDYSFMDNYKIHIVNNKDVFDFINKNKNKNICNIDKIFPSLIKYKEYKNNSNSIQRLAREICIILNRSTKEYASTVGQILYSKRDIFLTKK